MIAAVLDKHENFNLATRDVYLSTVGGMRLTDPSADLAIALAMASAQRNFAMPADSVVIGEVGLAGDLRRVTGMDRRLAEAARLGFRWAVVPAGLETVPAGMRVRQADTITAALRVVRTIADNSARS